MTWLTLYLFIKYWLPLLTFFGLLIKGFQIAGKSASAYANTLLDNHMSHVQDSVDKAAAAVTDLASYHKESLSLTKDILHELQEQRSDIRALAQRL